MKIESVDCFYLSMPNIEDVGDGSQDVLLVRVRGGGHTGWADCEAAPLVSIASLVCPMSHSACKPVQASVLGQRLEEPADIARIHRRVQENSLDLLQADHTLAGIDTALWDLLGRRLGEPVWRLMGQARSHPKLPYASRLFGDTPQDTLRKARATRQAGFRAAKFGWGPFGKGSPQADADHLAAAREGLEEHALLLVDAGTVWIDDVERAALTLPALEQQRAVWLEEPFVSGALDAYRALSRRSERVRLAGGEGCHNLYMARHMMDHAGLGFIQIDAGRIGLSTARQVAVEAPPRGITFVNHTFTSHLALSASLQPYAGLENHHLCEYPVEARPVARELTARHLVPDGNGHVRAPERPGLGLEPDPATVRRYRVDAEIRVGGRVLYRPPEW